MKTYETKGERREHKRNKRRKMKVSGKSVQGLQKIIEKKADKLRRKQFNEDRDTDY